MFNFTATPPLSLYIHIPWCIKKCPYCDFNSHQNSHDIPEAQYIEALIKDLEQDLPSIWGRTVESIFIGGGTPSLLSAQGLDQLLSAIRARLPLRPNLEITMEANPGTFEQEKFKDFFSAGINRLSIGIQSFDDEKLKTLGRIHNAFDAKHAIEIAYQAGFENINLDLMFGLPNQTTQQALADIDQALAHSPNHLSLYQLTIEPNTLFHSTPPQLPDDEINWEMQLRCQEKLADAGLIQYETSAYAKADRACHHNLNYWQFGDYLGIGAGAHAKITDASAQSITRSFKPKHPQTYMNHAGQTSGINGQTILSRHDVGLEFMMNALRLSQGFPLSLYYERTGLNITQLTKSLEEAEQRGLIERDLHHIQTTALGRQFLNELLMLFMPDK